MRNHSGTPLILKPGNAEKAKGTGKKEEKRKTEINSKWQDKMINNEEINGQVLTNGILKEYRHLTTTV